jgi:ClpP class serine protease
MTLARWIAMADANENIQSIIIAVDSPGGQVDGTQSLADAIRACSKKTIGYIDDGMAASAGYWIVSACDEIVSSHNTNNIGSIGVFVQMANFAKYYKEAHKLEIHTIYAEQSTEKNLPVRNVMEGGEHSDALIKAEMLNPIAEAFINAVKANRGDKINLSEGNPFAGKLYMSEEALKIGLIDRIEKLDQVITGLSSSGTSKPLAEIQLNQNPEMKKLSISALWTGLLAMFAITPEAGKESFEVEADEGKMNEILAKAELSISLEAKVQELNNKLSASENLATERLASIEQLQSEVESLKAAPGSGPHQVVRDTPDADANADVNEAHLSDVDIEARKAYAESQNN